MKKLSLFFITALLGAHLINSCSIERRYHRTGFNVNWNNASIKMKKDKNSNYSEVDVISEDLAKTNTVRSTNNSNTTYAVISDNSVASNVTDISTVIEPNTNEIQSISNVSLGEKSSTLAHSTTTDSKLNQTVRANKNSHKLTVKAKNKILKSSALSPEPWVYVLLIFLVPFGTTISMYLYEGSWTKRVTVNLILTLLCGLPGLIHALVVIFGKK